MTILLGDCRAGMRYMPENSVHSIVTDPPYGLSKSPNMREVLKHWLNGDDYNATGSGFMGKSWDSFVPGPATWAEAYRILKPGGVAAVFAGSRTVDLMATSLRLAGFEIFDMGHWLYSTGFPKSLSIEKQFCACDTCGVEIDQSQTTNDEKIPEHDLRPVRDPDISEAVHFAGESREVLQPCLSQQSSFEQRRTGSEPKATRVSKPRVEGRCYDVQKERELHRRGLYSSTTAPYTDGEKRRVHNAASGSNGEHVWEANVAERSSQSHRPRPEQQCAGKLGDVAMQRKPQEKRVGDSCDGCGKPFAPEGMVKGFGTALKPCHEPIIFARKPLDGTYANNIMTHGCGALNIDGCRTGDFESHVSKSVGGTRKSQSLSMGHQSVAVPTGEVKNGRWPGNVWHDGGLPEPMATYFYHAKASRADREAGLELFNMATAGECTERTEGSDGLNSPRAGAGRTGGSRNIHPTVKPTELMRWLVRLVTPPGGLCADPFVGSGSTPRACALEGFPFIGWEIDPAYHAIAEARSKI